MFALARTGFLVAALLSVVISAPAQNSPQGSPVIGAIQGRVTIGGKLAPGVEFNEPREIHFKQIDADDTGWVRNTIDEDDLGLKLTFTFVLRFEGLVEESAKERDRGEQAKLSLMPAVDKTIKIIRTLVGRGEL